jgi:ketol-acid reductoisomerase
MAEQPSGMTCFTERDADPSVLAGQRVAIVGYGNLGRPAALNLRDAGLDVVVGSRPGPGARQAAADGFTVLDIASALGAAGIVWLALPDEVIPEVLAPTAPTRLAPGAMLVVSSGYALAYQLVKLPEDIDAVMLAPRMIGSRLRTASAEGDGDGFHAFLSVEQDASGTARARLLALAHAFGALRAGSFELPAATEAALDLFVEQTVGPYLGAAVLSAFEVGTAAGLPPEALALELYLSGEMAATWQSFARHGFYAGVRLHGHASAYGGFVRLGGIDLEGMKSSFAAILGEITDGTFARQFQEELAAGSPTAELIDAMVAGDDPLTRAETAVRRSAAG